MKPFDSLTASAAPAREMHTLDRLRVVLPRGGRALPEPMNDKTKLRMKLLMPLFALALAGCASTPPPQDSSASHPANAEAAQGTVPPPVPMLMNITNMVMVKPVTEPAPEHQQSHGQHGAKPKAKEPKK